MYEPLRWCRITRPIRFCRNQTSLRRRGAWETFPKNPALVRRQEELPLGPRIHHVALAVRDTAAALKLYVETLGLSPGSTQLHEREQVKITFLEGGSTRLEILEPVTADSAVGRFLERRGEGMHHVCFEVDDLQEAITRFRVSGYEVVDAQPRQGLHGERLIFLHPKSTHGTMIELYERRT